MIPFTVKGKTQGLLSAGPDIVVQKGILLGTGETGESERRFRRERRNSILSLVVYVVRKTGIEYLCKVLITP